MFLVSLRQTCKNAAAVRSGRIHLVKSMHHRHMAQFFAPNEKGEEENAPAQDSLPNSAGAQTGFLRSLRTPRTFLDPNKFYPEVEITDPSIMDSVLEVTYEPRKLWLDICTANVACSPYPGSFVEYILGAEIQFGIVLREPHARFNPYHNRMIVLTLHNELVKVCPQDVTFAMHRVLDSDSMPLAQILTNRFDETYIPRARLVQILHQFTAVVTGNRRLLAHSVGAVYSSIASAERANPVCLLELARLTHALDPISLPSYFHQSAFLMAMYLEMCSDSSRWMAPGCVPSERVTNLSFGSFSNALTPPPIIYATPTPVHDYILTFLEYSDQELHGFNHLLEEFITSPIKHDDLVLQFDIWDARRYSHALKAMMYAAVHPHSQILAKLSLLPVVGPHHPSRRVITSLLQKIGLYDNPQNPLTDPILSTGIFGKVKKHSLVASSSRDLDTSSLQHSAIVEANKNRFEDNFPHLRHTRQYFHDTTAYVLPGINSNLAISMEEINSRRFLINIHVADFASRVSPSSATFAKWSVCDALMDNTKFLQGIEKTKLFPAEATHEILFNKTRSEVSREYFVVGDSSDEKTEKSGGDSQTCMTMSFEYNSYLKDPIQNLSESAKVSFDALRVSQLKTLDSSALEASLTGKLEPSIFKKFKLFKHSDAQENIEKKQLDTNDHYTVNFIYNILRKHFEARNRNYAVSTSPSNSPRDVNKTFTADPNSEKIETHVTLAQEIKSLEKTRFLRTESEILAGRIAAEYAERNKIPVFHESKSLIYEGNHNSKIRDGVFIKHDNSLLPDFTAASYFQIPYGRDVSGHIPTSAHIVASNFLGIDTVSTDPDTDNVPLGLHKGLVNVVDATESIRAYINQLQILQHVHFTQTATAKLFQEAHRFSHLKALGYNLHGAMSRATIERHAEKFMACSIGSSYLVSRQRKYWVLKAVEQDRADFTELRCVITHVCKEIDMGLEASANCFPAEATDSGEDRWAYSECQSMRAYCVELGIEVDILVDRERRVMIGSEQIASKILDVDAALGRILLGGIQCT